MPTAHDGATKHRLTLRSCAVSGPQGPKGDTGPQGPKGDTGPQGPKGDDAMPPVTAADNGSFMRVVNGSWAAAALPSAESEVY